jgi:hypothetical protein
MALAKPNPTKAAQREFEPPKPTGGAASPLISVGAFRELWLGALTADPSPLPSDNVWRVWCRSDLGIVYGNFNGSTQQLWPPTVTGENDIQRCSGDLALTTTYADLTGCSFNVTLAGTYLIIGNVKVLGSGAGWGTALMRLQKAGTAQTPVMEIDEGTNIQLTQVWVLSLAAGDNLKLQVKKSINAGTATAKATDSVLTAMQLVLPPAGTAPAPTKHAIHPIIFTPLSQALVLNEDWSPNVGYRLPPSGEHGTFVPQRLRIRCKTAGTGTNTIELQTSSTLTGARTTRASFTLANTANEEQETTSFGGWSPADNEYLWVRATGVGGTAPQDLAVQLDLTEVTW